MRKPVCLCRSDGIDRGRRYAGGASQRAASQRANPQHAAIRARPRLAEGAAAVAARRSLQHRHRRAGQYLGAAAPAHAQARAGQDDGAGDRGVRRRGQFHQGVGRRRFGLRMAAARARHPHRPQGLRLGRRQQLRGPRAAGLEAGRRRSAHQVHPGRQAGAADRQGQRLDRQCRHREPASAGRRLGASADQRDCSSPTATAITA